MDPFGVVSAVVTTFVAVHWLCDNCGNPANAADQRYSEFAAAICGLDRAVQNIEQDLRYGWGNDDGSAARDARAIKDAFVGLLEECEQLLIKHASLRYDRPNVLQNIAWGANVQPKIDQLLGRIALQTQRATYFYSTLSHRTQSEMAAQIDYLTRTLNPELPRALELDPARHSIPPDVIDSFCRATLRRPPQGYISPNNFPFRTGFNTLRRHLEQSTTQSPTGTPQPIHQYISLLKAQWLLETIKKFDYFKSLRQGTKDRSDIQELENIIVKQLTRQDLTLYSVQDLLGLPPNHFFIWETAPKNLLPSRMQPFQEEKEILSAELPVPPNHQHCRLVVFRDLGHNPGTLLRIVRQWKKDSQLLSPIPNPFDAFSHMFNPLYALSSSPDHHLSVELSNADGSQPELYEFKEPKDLFKFQWAVTNYNVFSDLEDVDWAITRGMKSNLDGKASRIQLWWFDPDDDLEKLAAETITPASRNSGKTSIFSAMTSTAARSILQGSESHKMLSSPSPPTIHSKTEVVEAILPYNPLLIILAKRNRRPEYVSLQLHGQIYIDQNKCRCKREPGTCVRSVIRSSNNGECQVKRVHPNDVPNLAIFARPYRKGGPQHPRMSNAESVSTRELTLDFADAAQRRRFNSHLEFILRLQRSREETHAMLQQRALYLSNKPMKNGNVKDRIVGVIEPISSNPNSPTTCSTPRGIEDTSSDSSNISMAESEIYTYADCLVHDLYHAISSTNLTVEYGAHFKAVLPDLLVEFAGRIIQEDPSKEGQEVMIYVLNHRKYIERLFERHFVRKHANQEISELSPSIDMSFGDAMDTWLTDGSLDTGLQENTRTNVLSGAASSTPLDTFGSVETYREFVAKTNAYTWLLTNIRRNITRNIPSR